LGAGRGQGGQQTRARVAGVRTVHYDITDGLPRDELQSNYGAVMFAHTAQFIPVTTDDALLEATVRHVASFAAHAFYLSTTSYPEQGHPRPWLLAGEPIGFTPFYSRPLTSLQDILERAGLRVTWCEHFKSDDPSGYENDYLVAER
jgi:hypothetical protein